VARLVGWRVLVDVRLLIDRAKGILSHLGVLPGGPFRRGNTDRIIYKILTPFSRATRNMQPNLVEQLSCNEKTNKPFR
jgi:hypothetical protein